MLQKDISSHVVRQNKARQGKQGSPVSKSYGSKNSSLLPVEAMKESDNNYIDIDQRRLATPPSSPVQNSSAGLNGSHGPATLVTFAHFIGEAIYSSITIYYSTFF